MAGDPIDHAGVGAERPAEDEGGRQRSPRRGPGQAGLSRWAQGAMLLLCLAAALSLRLHRADVPLERDEGEFAYVGQLLLEGQIPFVAAYNMKLPGIYYAYAAALAAGGGSVEAIRLGHAAVNAVTIVLIFLLGRRLVGGTAAVLAAVVYACLSLLPPVLGSFAHATHFVVAFALAGLWLLERERDRPPRPLALFAAGLCLGLAVTMKQHGVAFAAFGAVVLAVRLRAAGEGAGASASALGAFAAGGLAPLLLIAALLHAHEALGTFWFWTVEYGAQYATQTSLARGAAYFLANALPLVLGGALPLWLFAAIGAVGVALGRLPAPRAHLLGLLAASGIALLPGLYFRPHYFVLVLPAAALLAGAGLLAVGRRLAEGRAGTMAVGLLVVSLAYVGAAYGRLLVRLPADGVSHATYADEFFPEMRQIAEELGRRSSPGDTLAVFGSEPEIYFYAGRRAATGYLYVYPLMEPQPAARRMQEQMVQEIESASPRFVVHVHVPHSWGLQHDSEPYLLEWMDGFLKRYRRVGLVDLRTGGRSRFFWDAAGRGRRPGSPTWAAVYERSDGVVPDA